jgi:hypothetical protein
MEGIKQARRMLLDRATLLHETYIKHGAPAEVNISDKMKSDIAMILTKQFQEIYPKDLLMVTLQEAQDEIVSIMAKGTYCSIITLLSNILNIRNAFQREQNHFTPY